MPLTWYEDLFRAIKERYPAFKLHALSPPEVIHLSRLSQLPVPAVIDRLISAGLAQVIPQPATAPVAGFIYFAVALPWFLIGRYQARRGRALASDAKRPGPRGPGPSAVRSG